MTNRAQQITNLSPEEKRALLVELLKKKAQADYPLSYNQRTMWLLYQLVPGSAAYHVAYTARIRSTVDVPALKRAFQALIARHSTLRTTYRVVSGEPRQQVHVSQELHFEEVDASSWDEDELDVQVAAAYARPFDLTEGPVLRVHLFTQSATDRVLLIVAHHISFDGWSLWLLLDELRILYQTESAGQAAALPPLKLKYTDYARWQGDMLKTSEGERLWAYWQGQLSGELPELNLPTDRPRPPIQTFNGASDAAILNAVLTQQLKELAKSEGATLYMVLLAGFQALLSRYAAQEDILVGSPVSGRSRAEFSGMIGHFVNMIVLRADLSRASTFRMFLGQVRQVVLDAFAHQEFPFPLLVERLAPRRDPSRSSIFQAAFALQKPQRFDAITELLGADGESKRMDFGGLEIEFYPFHQQEGQFDLALEMIEARGQLISIFKYNTDLFDAPTIARMQEHFRNLLAGIVADPEQAISALPLLTEGEREQMLFEWNTTQQELPPVQLVHALFEAQVAQTPDAVAIVFHTDQQTHQLTYTELNRRANQLAHRLQKVGVGPDVLVGICVERSLDIVMGLLGTLKAGGAYLPFDPTYPPRRLAFMLEDTRVSVLLTQAKLVDRLLVQPTQGANQPTLVYLDTDWGYISQEADTNPRSGVTPENLAYVIYTSGSTGWPKGVLLAHKGLCNLVQAQAQAFGVTGDSHVLQFASFSFDAAVSETFMALLKGATLYLTPQEKLASIADLGQLLNDLAITTVTLPPSVLTVLPAEELPTLQTVISAGEACSPEIVAHWAPGRRFFNAYGPTEATIGPTLYPVEGSLDGATSVPIGQPIANTQVYLLDARLQPMPVGVSGELHIGGVGLARGYLDRPELTAQKFVPHPFSGEPGARLYRTGDLARYRSDGNIEFVGRIDYQVKVRGFRIELGEIEAVLHQHPSLQAAVVVTRRDTPGDGAASQSVSGIGSPGKRLVAYVVPEGESVPNVNELRGFLQQKLAEYMVPSVFVTLDALPLTPNGKVDRKALPAPTSERPDLETTYVMPQNELQRTIASIWQEVLGVDQVGIHDNFFDLGGHSLMVAKIHNQLQEMFQRELSMVEMFQYPTVGALAAYLSREHKEGASVQRGVERASKQVEAIQRQRQRMSVVARRQVVSRRRG